MRTRAIIAAAGVVMLATMTGAEARVRRVVHVYADTIVIHPRAVSLPVQGIIVHGTVRAPQAKRSTRAALIACQMGPNFLGEAWRGKRYRPFTRTGRPRICMTGA
jgi:hypothetical protein